jgi:hypothetical protein
MAVYMYLPNHIDPIVFGGSHPHINAIYMDEI